MLITFGEEHNFSLRAVYGDAGENGQYIKKLKNNYTLVFFYKTVGYI